MIEFLRRINNMSAFLSKIMRVEVKGGDAIANNRTEGKSNTGTYFLCSLKDWEKYEKFVPDDGSVEYFIDLGKVQAYKNSFGAAFFGRRNSYPDKMRNFEAFCDSLCAFVVNPQVVFTTRKNDSRVFLKFDSNTKSEVEKQLRDILYADLSYLVFELVNKTTCLVYPEINTSKTKEENE